MRVQGLAFRDVQGLALRDVQGLAFRVQGMQSYSQPDSFDQS